MGILKNFSLRLLSFIIIYSLSVSSCGNKDKKFFSFRKSKSIEQSPLQVDANTLKEWKEKIGDYYSQLHRNAHFNGNVLVARQGNIIYSGSFGVKDLITNDSLDINSVFQIASVSKTFTAMAIMSLVEKGKINLHQKLGDFFIDFPYKDITVEDLLTHRSGLPNYLSVTEKDWSKDGPKTNKELLKYFKEKQPKPLGKPNRSFSYNNSNYALLALIIEQVSGMPYEDYMKKNIFKPLGMNNTYIYSAQHQILPTQNLTKGYQNRNREDEMVASDGIVGDKNIYSTVLDLLKWERANSHTILFKQSTLDSSVVGRSNEKQGVRNYGYGWRISQNPNFGKIIYHNGWWHGYTAAFARNPKDETVIIVLSNIYNKSTYKTQPVWDILYGEGAFSSQDFNE
ncbi:MAG: beta-lactamase family protein [Chitinophagales bacterium]|nr:beta-lactamase family protein [Chitinophagales bacterium]